MKMKIINALLLVGCLGATSAFADGSLQNLKQSSEQSVRASGNFALGSTQAVVGVVAAPLKIVGKIGDVSNGVGNELWDFAIHGAKKPLAISEETITIGPNPKLSVTAN